MKKYLFVIAMSIVLTQNTFAASTGFLSIDRMYGGGGNGLNNLSRASCSSQYAFDKSEYEPNAIATITIVGSGDTDAGFDTSYATCNSRLTPGTLSIDMVRFPSGIIRNPTTNTPKTINVPTALGTYTVPITLEVIHKNSTNTTSANVDYKVVSTPPTPTSTPPMLQLNGRAAFLHQLLFTSAFAQDKKQVSNIIADVEIQQVRLISQENRTIKASVTLENKIGTQAGILYGIQVYKKDGDSKMLLDEYALQDPLTLNQNQSITKEITYVLPLSISGDVELFVYTSTNKGILLGAALLGTVSLPTTKLALSMNSCTLSDQAVVCDVQNTANVTATTTLTTTVKAGNSSFGTTLDTYNATLVLKKGETQNVTQSIKQGLFTQDVYIESTLFDASGFPISRKTMSYVRPVKKVSINNVLVEQTSKRDYAVKVVSLARPTAPHAVVVALNDASGVCATVTGPMTETMTTFVLSSKKACMPVSITTTIADQAGNVMDEVTQEYTNSFKGKDTDMNQNTLWFIGGLLIAVLLILFLTSRRKPEVVM